jgi:hypothetical protein
MPRVFSLLCLSGLALPAQGEVVGISWDIDGKMAGGVFAFAPNGTAQELAPFSNNLRTLDSVADDDAGTLHLVVMGASLVPFHVANRSFGAPVRVDCSRCDAGCCFEEWHFLGGGQAVALALGWRSSGQPSDGAITNAVVSVDLATGVPREIMPFDVHCAVISAASTYSRRSQTLWAWLGCDVSSQAASLVAFDVAAPPSTTTSTNATWLTTAKFPVAPLLPTADGRGLLGLQSGVGWVRIARSGVTRNVTAPLPGIAEDHTALLVRTPAAAAVAAAASAPASVVSVVVYDYDQAPPRRQVSYDADSGELLSSVPLAFGVRELHVMPVTLL